MVMVGVAAFTIAIKSSKLLPFLQALFPLEQLLLLAIFGLMQLKPWALLMIQVSGVMLEGGLLFQAIHVQTMVMIFTYALGLILALTLQVSLSLIIQTILGNAIIKTFEMPTTPSTDARQTKPCH